MPVVELSPGRATPAGTRRYAGRFGDRPGHFRAPDSIVLSSLGLGLRAGAPHGADALLYRSAVSQLLRGGVNVFVTGIAERMQMSERNLGAALERAFREGEAARDEVFVASRAGALAPDADAVRTPADARRHLVATYLESGLVDPDDVVAGAYCFAPRFLRDQIERSRRNLRLATLDLYAIEAPELLLQSAGPTEFRRRICGAFEALEAAVADGAIAAWGLCTWDGLLRPHADRHHLSLLDLFDWALEVGGPDHHLRAIQLPCSLAVAEALRLPSQLGLPGGSAAVLDLLRDTGTAVFASAPLVHGRALGRLPAFVREAFPGLRSDAQRCLHFARSAPGVTTAVVGMRDPEHVSENLALTKQPPCSAEALGALFLRAEAASEPDA
jgi:aryl-alcohol dehydrogenase-like predicted oxidoreductase